MLKKIDVFVNGAYVYSSVNYRTCKEAVQDVRQRANIKVASIPDYMIRVNDTDKITAKIDHDWRA